MMKASIRVLAAVLAVSLYLMSVTSFAQNNQSTPPAASGQGVLPGPQLEALVAPIALYPDALLSEVLMASTYPLEIVAADRWVKSNKNLHDDQLKAAVEQQSWDQSVKSLAATPDVLDMMSNKLDWTQKLGDAVLAQQPEVMDAIQRLRQKAQSRGKLTTTAQQTVITQLQGDKQAIVIEPTQPDTVYVPYYDPAVVYGDWPYSEYPPYYFGVPGYIAPGVIATGLAFGGAYALSRWVFNGRRWGGGLNWGNNQINPLRSVNNVNIGNNNWVHNPAHRQGLRYNNSNVAQRFGDNRNHAAQNRGNFRGSNGQQVLNPGGDRSRRDAGTGARPGSGNATASHRAAKGKAAANNLPSQNGGNRSGKKTVANKKTSANRIASKPTNAGNRTAAHRTNANRSAANRGAKQMSSRHAGPTPGRGTYAYAGGARGMGGARPGGGGGFRAGGGRGGGRRSDLRLKHDVVEIGRLANGIGLYRFVYNGGHTAYVGVIAQEVQGVVPAAVTQGTDGYLRVHYDKLGLKFQTYRDWLRTGGAETLSAPFAR